MWKSCVVSVLVGLHVVLLSYLFNTPVPDTLESPWRYRTIVAILKLQGLIAYIVGKAGGNGPEFFQQSLRTYLEKTAPNLHESVQTHNDVYDGVPVRVYQGKSGGKNRAALMYFHGGGFYYGSPYAYEHLCEMMVLELDMVVVNIDYRLSLQHPSPAALEDARKVAYHLQQNADHLGINPDKIGVSGDSAGGALAAALSLWLRDHDEPPRLAFQVLFYPWLQSFDFGLPSYEADTAGKSFVTRAGIAISTLLYINKTRSYVKDLVKNAHISKEAVAELEELVDWKLLPKDLVQDDYKKQGRDEPRGDFDPEVEEQVLDPYNFPLMARDLSGLPPAYILTVDHDVLRDEGIIYAKRLEKAGIPVVLHNDARGWHGMMSFLRGMLKFDVAIEVAQETVEFIKSKL